jgi:hypothetical protein
MNPDGTGATPSIATIGKAAGLKDRATRDHITGAIAAGWLERPRRGHRVGDVGVTSLYRAVIPQPAPSCQLNPTSSGTVVPVEQGSTGTVVPINRHAHADQPAPSCRLPDHDQTNTTTSARDELVEAALFLEAEEGVTKQADPNVVSVRAVAKARLGSGTYDTLRRKLLCFAADHPEITEPAQLRAQHRRMNALAGAEAHGRRLSGAFAIDEKTAESAIAQYYADNPEAAQAFRAAALKQAPVPHPHEQEQAA